MAEAMTFCSMKEKLIRDIRRMVHNGELTERRLARITGVSQPHMHNVLKGARTLTSELADQMIYQLQLALPQFETDEARADCSARTVPLLGEKIGSEMMTFNPDRISGTVSFSAHMLLGVDDPVAAYLGDDLGSGPVLLPGDLLLIDISPTARSNTIQNELYVVEMERGIRLCHIREGSMTAYLITPERLRLPAYWETVTLAGRSILDVVRGHVVWASRRL